MVTPIRTSQTARRATSPAAPGRLVPGLLCAVLLALAAACGPSQEQIEADRAAIEETLREYTEQLSQAYAFSDPSVLSEVAWQREVSSVENNIARLAQEGRRIASNLEQLTVEDVNVFRVGNAYVRSFEVWEIRVMALGSDRVLSRDDAQESRVRYYLKTDDDGSWKVVWRQRLGETGAPAPQPDGGSPSGGE